MRGWRQLERETQQARTFAKVREAGERFGRVMGAQVGRLLVMLATAALGSTTNLLMKGSRTAGLRTGVHHGQDADGPGPVRR